MITFLVGLMLLGIPADNVTMLLESGGGGGGCGGTDWSADLGFLWDAEASGDLGNDAFPAQVTDQELTDQRGTPTQETTIVLEGSGSLNGSANGASSHVEGTYDSGQAGVDKDRDFTRVFPFYVENVTGTKEPIFDQGGQERLRVATNRLQKDDTASGLVNVTGCTSITVDTWWVAVAVFDWNGTNFDITYYCAEAGDSSTLSAGMLVSGVSGNTSTFVGWCGNRNNANSFDGYCDAGFEIDGTALSSAQVEGVVDCGYDGDGW